MTFLRNALEAASDDDGWAPLAGVGNIITNQRPDFDPRSYGYRKLSDLITATTLFETDRRSPGDGKQPIIYARLKRRRSPAKRTTAAKRTAVKVLRRSVLVPASQQPLRGGCEVKQGKVTVAAPGELQPHREA